jgi:hypothetical protein
MKVEKHVLVDCGQLIRHCFVEQFDAILVHFRAPLSNGIAVGGF